MKFYFLILTCIAIGFISVTSCKRLQDPPGKNAIDSVAVKDSADPQIKTLTEKIRRDPGNPEHYFIRSNIFLQLNNIAASFSDMSKAIALDSTNLKYYFAIADIYLKGGSADLAIDAFKTIIRLDPPNEEALIKLSKVYFYKKDYRNSMLYLSKVQELDKDNFETYFIRGMNYKEMGDTNLAFSSFQKAIQVKPGFYDGYMQLGLLASKKPGSQAAQYFDNAIRLDSSNAEAYYGKAKFYQDHGQYAKAKDVYHELITRDPQYEQAYFNLGFIYIKQDSIDKAYRMFDYAIKVTPSYAEAYYYRGLCSLEKGNKEQAETDFRQAIALKPDYELAQKELNNLTAQSPH